MPNGTAAAHWLMLAAVAPRLDCVFVRVTEACAVTLKDNSKDTGMFCHPELNLCVLKCSTDADCPAAWTCDSRQETLDTAGQPVCVNPTCGDL